MPPVRDRAARTSPPCAGNAPAPHSVALRAPSPSRCPAPLVAAEELKVVREELTRRLGAEEAKSSRLVSELDEARAATEWERSERIRKLNSAHAAVRVAEEQLVAMNVRRRDLVNRLQEANGSIRVLCRCRPLAPSEAANGEAASVTAPAHNAITLSPIDGESAEFRFDAAFGPDSKQRALYEEISPAVASVLGGQYVCVLAYGQTGAGKTYTMQGSRGQPGVVHLAIEELLREGSTLSAEARQRGEDLEVHAI